MRRIKIHKKPAYPGHYNYIALDSRGQQIKMSLKRHEAWDDKAQAEFPIGYIAEVLHMADLGPGYCYEPGLYTSARAVQLPVGLKNGDMVLLWEDCPAFRLVGGRGQFHTHFWVAKNEGNLHQSQIDSSAKFIYRGDRLEIIEDRLSS